MYRFREISGLTRVAIVALWVYLVANVIEGAGSFYADILSNSGAGPDDLKPTDILSLVKLLVFLIAGIIVLRWIYRASVNAHAIAGDLSITPGWAVGWYFIPIANLWKPFQGMKETWLASHYGPDWGGHSASDLLNWWWGLWVLSSILGNASFRIASMAPQLSAELGLVDAVISVPLTLLLIRILQEVRTAQDVTRHAEVFA